MEQNKNIVIILISAILALILGYLLGSFNPLTNSQNENNKVEHVVLPNGETKTFRQPALVYFYGKDCSSCQKFKPNWNIIKRKYGKKFHIIEVDVDNVSNGPLCYEFMVNIIPALHIEDAEFRNRAFINPAEYSVLPRLQDTIDRYLIMRKILIKGASAN